MKLSPKAKPLLKVITMGKEEIVAWTLEREVGIKGLSLGIKLWHFHPNYGIESFRKEIINGNLRTANIEVTNKGAAVAIDTEKHIKVGPD